MKRLVLAVVLMVSLNGVYAEEVKQAEQQPVHVALISAETTSGADLKVSPSDYPNGIFIKVNRGGLPKSAAIFADKLRAHGFKIADTAENADVLFKVGSTTINFKDIENNTDSIAPQKIDGVAGAVIAGVFTGGLSLLVTDYSFLSNNKPTHADMWVNVESGKKEKQDKDTFLSGTIKADASNSTVTRASFDLMSEAWLKAHLNNEGANGAPSL